MGTKPVTATATRIVALGLFLQWMRLMAGFSFAWTVAFGYGLVAILLVEIWLIEDWLRRKLLARAMLTIGVLAGATWFTIAVVAIRAPVEVLAEAKRGEYVQGSVIAGIPWTDQLSDVRLSFVNPTSGDYEKFDASIIMDESLIIKIGQVGDLAGVSFHGDATKEKIEIGGISAMLPDLVQSLPDGRKVNVPLMQIATGRYRVLCNRLPSRASLDLILAVAYVDKTRTPGVLVLTPQPYPDGKSIAPVLFAPSGTIPVLQRRQPRELQVTATYLGGYRARSLQAAIVVQ